MKLSVQEFFFTAAIVMALSSCSSTPPRDARAYPDSDGGSLESLSRDLSVWTPNDMSSPRFSADVHGVEPFLALTYDSPCSSATEFRSRNDIADRRKSADELSNAFQSAAKDYGWNILNARAEIWRNFGGNVDVAIVNTTAGACRTYFVLFTV